MIDNVQKKIKLYMLVNFLGLSTKTRYPNYRPPITKTAQKNKNLGPENFWAVLVITETFLGGFWF